MFAFRLKLNRPFLKLEAACFAFVATILLFGANTADSFLSKRQLTLAEELTLIANLPASKPFGEFLAQLQKSDPAIQTATPLKRSEVAELLQPWFDTGNHKGANTGANKEASHTSKKALELVELPQVAVLTVDRNRLNLPVLQKTLTQLANKAGITAELTDHKSHFSAVLRQIQALLVAKWLMLVAMTLGLATATFLAIQSALRGEATTIEILSIIGATNRSIANYFAMVSGYQVFLGAAVGLQVAVVGLFAFDWFFGWANFWDLGVGGNGGFYLIGMPFALGGFTAIVASGFVSGLLKRSGI